MIQRHPLPDPAFIEDSTKLLREIFFVGHISFPELLQYISLLKSGLIKVIEQKIVEPGATEKHAIYSIEFYPIHFPF